MMSSVQPAETFAMDNHLAQQPMPPAAEQEQLCYVHCNYCDTILAVGVPYSSLFKTVAVGCGHCANLLSVNLRGLLLPAANNNQQSLPAFAQQPAAVLSPTSPHGVLDELPFPAPSLLMSAEQNSPTSVSTITSSNNSCGNSMSAMSIAPPPKPSAARLEPQQPSKSAAAGNKEKRPRVPSAYNRFIKEEIQRIKALNPDIPHREAFSTAAKNWAHYPHIQFGVIDQGLKTTLMQNQDGGECMLFNDSLYAAAAAAAAASGMCIAPY